MKHQEGYFKGTGGINLYYQSWRPLDNPHAIVVIVHGLGSHSNLFGNIVQYLVKAGYAVYGLDLRGHGRSQGQRGHINSWSQYREDIQIFLKLIEVQEPKSPCFLLGDSLGAIIALDYVLRLASSVKGIITMAPPLGKVGISPVKMNLGRTLSAVMPRFALSVGLAGNQITRDLDYQSVLADLGDWLERHVKGGTVIPFTPRSNNNEFMLG